MKNAAVNLSGHIKRLQYIIKCTENSYPKTTFQILARMRCGHLVVVEEDLLPKKGMEDLILIGLATWLERRVTKHLKGCKICRIARKRMKRLLSKTARA